MRHIGATLIGACQLESSIWMLKLKVNVSIRMICCSSIFVYTIFNRTWTLWHIFCFYTTLDHYYHWLLFIDYHDIALVRDISQSEGGQVCERNYSITVSVIILFQQNSIQSVLSQWAISTSIRRRFSMVLYQNDTVSKWPENHVDRSWQISYNVQIVLSSFVE